MNPHLALTLSACLALGLPLIYLYYLKKNLPTIKPEIRSANAVVFGILFVNAFIGVGGKGAIDCALIVLGMSPGNPTLALGGLIGQSLVITLFGLILKTLLAPHLQKLTPAQILKLLLVIPTLWAIKTLGEGLLRGQL